MSKKAAQSELLFWHQYKCRSGFLHDGGREAASILQARRRSERHQSHPNHVPNGGVYSRMPGACCFRTPGIQLFVFRVPIGFQWEHLTLRKKKKNQAFLR